MGMVPLSLAALPMGIDLPTVAVVVVAVLSVVAPPVVEKVKLWRVRYLKRVLRSTQDPKVFLKAAETLRSLKEDQNLGDILLLRYMDMDPLIREEVRALAERVGEKDLLYRWFDMMNVVDRLTFVEAQKRNDRYNDRNDPQYLEDQYDRGRRDAERLMESYQLTPLERAEAHLRAVERADQGSPFYSQIVTDNFAELSMFRHQALLSKETSTVRGDMAPEIVAFDQKMFVVLSRIVEGSPNKDARIEVFNFVSPEDRKEIIARLLERIERSYKYFDVTVEFLLAMGLVDVGSLKAHVLKVLHKSVVNLPDYQRPEHIRALIALGLTQFEQEMGQLQYKKDIEDAVAKLPPQAVDQAMAISAVFTMAAMPFLASIDLSDQTALWSVRAVSLMGAVSLAVVVKHWTIQYFKSVLRKADDVQSFTKAAGILYLLMKQEAFFDELIPHYMDKQRDIRQETRALLVKYGQKDPFLRWIESASILPKLMHPGTKVRFTGFKLLESFRLTQLEQAELSILVLERGINKSDPVSADVINENLSNFISSRERSRLLEAPTTAQERLDGASLDRRAANIIVKILGWGPEDVFETALRAFDLVAPNVPRIENSYRGVIEAAPNLKARREFFGRLAVEDRKQAIRDLWDHLKQPHMSYDTSVRFAVQTGMIDKEELTAHVLYMLQQSHYIRDPLRATHIKALNDLGLKQFKQDMDQQQFKKAIDKAIGESKVPRVVDEAMVIPAVFAMAAVPSVSSVIDGVIHFVNDHPEGISTYGVVAAGLSFGVFMFLRYRDGQRHQQRIVTLRSGSASSRVQALADLKGKMLKGNVEYAFRSLMNDESIELTPDLRSILEQAGFSFEPWLLKDMPTMLLSSSNIERFRARGLLGNKVTPLQQMQAYSATIKLLHLKFKNTKNVALINGPLLEVLDQMLRIHTVLPDTQLSLPLQNILLELAPLGDIASIREIVSFLSAMPLEKKMSEGEINKDIIKRMGARLQQPEPLLNVKDVVEFLREHFEPGDEELVRSRINEVLGDRGRQMVTNEPLINDYLDALVMLGAVMSDEDKEAFKAVFKGQVQTSSDPAEDMQGGIDVTSLNVQHTGKGINVAFDPAMLNEFSQGTFRGFTPVIVGFTPASSVSSALGL